MVHLIRPYASMLIIFLALIPTVGTVTSQAAQRLSPEELLTTVSMLATLYQSRGHDDTVIMMKQLRKKTGPKVIFSIVHITGKDAGKILYHPTPMVTGRYIHAGVDAENRRPGSELLEKAVQTEPGSPLWLRYSLRDTFGDRVLRTMCCVRVSDQAVCGSMPQD